MNTFQMVISTTLLILGAGALLISGIGILRLPTFLTRLHPVAKSTTLGIMLFFAGVAVAEPTWTPRLLVAVVLFMFTGPVSASALARTALTAEEKEKYYPSSTEDESSTEEKEEE